MINEKLTYLSSHFLKVVSGAADQISEPEDGTIRMVLFVIEASLQVAVIRSLQHIGPKRQQTLRSRTLRELNHKVIWDQILQLPMNQTL